MPALILSPFDEHALARLRERMPVTHESWLESRRLHDPEELGARIRSEGIDVLVVEADFVFEEVFDAASGLRFVGVCRNALNQVDLPSAREHGVIVTHAPGRNTNAVVELVLGCMLAMARRLPLADRFVSGGGWRDPAAGYSLFRGREIAGSTVGVVGFGQIGREVAQKCLALGAQVVAHDPLVPPRDMETLGVRPAALHEAAAVSDFLTLHVPDVPETRYMVDAALLATMRPDSYLINTSAGTAVDHEVLVQALETGRLAGAALDVFEGHPLPASSPLLSAPNLLLTPHIGGATAETVQRHSQIITDEIERFLDGKPLLHAVTAQPMAARAG
jgi:D-3-phosphoglycerate dehydrogenase